MKRFFAAILLVGVLFSLHAAAPSYTAVDGVYEWYDTTITVDDTLTAAADTVTILSNQDIEQGWQYILTRNAFTGDGSDSTDASVVVEYENSSGTTLYSVVVDSFTASAGEAVDLEIGGSGFDDQFDLHIIGLADVGGECIMPSTFNLVKRRPYVWQRRK